MTHGGLPEHDASTQAVLRMKRWLSVFLGMGFLGLTVDVFLEHYFTIHSMRHSQWIPVVFGLLVGAIALGTAWRFEGVTLRLFGIASWISLVIRVEVGRGARVQRAIVDEGVRIPPGMVVGYDPVEDAKRFCISDKGIVVVSDEWRRNSATLTL